MKSLQSLGNIWEGYRPPHPDVKTLFKNLRIFAFCNFGQLSTVVQSAECWWWWMGLTSTLERGCDSVIELTDEEADGGRIVAIRR